MNHIGATHDEDSLRQARQIQHRRFFSRFNLFHRPGTQEVALPADEEIDMDDIQMHTVCLSRAWV